MKIFVTIAVLIGALGIPACTKKVTDVPITDDMDSNVTILYSGRFISGPYGVTMGIAQIETVDNRWQLRLDSFTVSNGPDLKVYLSREQQPIHFISLGSLRSTNGSQVYSISGMPDIASYKYALIHCEKYNHLFGSAVLEMK